MTLRAWATLFALLVMAGCGNGGGFAGDAGLDADACSFCNTDAPPTCNKLECQVDKCGGDTAQTSIDGTVYAPNGTLPLYNVIVYVPNQTPDPFPLGVTCTQCGTIASGKPVAVALSDAQGHFSIKSAPSGSNIPLVMQIGKWRRQVTIPVVHPCVANHVGSVQNGVEQLTRLPAKQSEGDMPRIAITTGTCDHLGCILPKIGIDSSEFAPGPATSNTPPATAVSFYSAENAPAPPNSPDAKLLWNSVFMLMNFDAVIFSDACYVTEGPAADSSVREYLDKGGRVFTTGHMYTWYKYSPDANLNAPPWQYLANDVTTTDGGAPVALDTSFPKAQSLSAWLAYVGSIPPYKAQMIEQPPIKDQFPIREPYGTVSDDIYAVDPQYGLEWAHSGPENDAGGAPQHPRIVTMNMPTGVPAGQQCGKAVHLDMHISTQDFVLDDFPFGCTPWIREPELVTTFFLFDLTSCIQDDRTDPPVPK